MALTKLQSQSIDNNITVAGVVTATSFYGDGSNLTGIGSASNATYAESSGIATYATTAGVATYSSSSGIATYSDTAGIATYSPNAGVSTYSSTSGISTYATLSGVTTYANTAGIATYAASSGIATYATSSGIATYSSSSGISTYATSSGIATYSDTTGIATYSSSSGISTYATTAGIATALQSSRTFEITGDVIASAVSFDGTGNVSLAATIQPNSVALGNDTTGDYVQSISGTSNQITVTGGTGESSTPTLSLPTNLVVPQDLSVTRDLQVDRNLNVNGNITIGGTSAYIAVTELKVSDPDLVLGFRTDGSGNDVSNDNTANHGGIAIASTEGTPLVSLYDVGIGETNPTTYKKIMWFKEGTFAGLGTDAWLFNYAVGIGSTQFPTGTRLSVGSVQFTENDLAVVRNINASGIVTASSFSGNATSATYANTTGIATYSTTAGVSTNVSGGTASVTSLNVSGISTLGTLQVSSGIVTATSGIITYYGDGSKLSNVISGIGIGTTGGVVGYGITFIDLKGAGVSTTFYNSNVGIATIFFEGGGGGSGSIGIGTQFPVSSSSGDLFFHIDYGRTFVYYDEVALGVGSTAFWVDAAPFNQQITNPGVGIQSAGVAVGTGITVLNFIGLGNTFAVNGTTVDISISGNSGAGGTWATYNAGIATSKSVGINTSTLDDSDLTGIGNSFQGLYVSNGMIIVDNVLSGNHYIGTNFNGLMAGPVTITGTLTVDGNYVVV